MCPKGDCGGDGQASEPATWWSKEAGAGPCLGQRGLWLGSVDPSQSLSNRESSVALSMLLIGRMFLIQRLMTLFDHIACCLLQCLERSGSCFFSLILLWFPHTWLCSIWFSIFFSSSNLVNKEIRLHGSCILISRERGDSMILVGHLM